MEGEHIELAEMPTKEMLEAFLTSLVMNTAVTVTFNAELGVFEGNPNA